MNYDDAKYDDASWHHGGGDFPADSPDEYGGTHIGLFLRYCFTKGWAGELHTEEQPEAVAAVIDGTMSGTDFLFRYCDGKLTDEDLNAEGNAFAKKYYGKKGRYLGDYAQHFEDQVYLAPESAHDFAEFSKMIEARLASGKLTG
ncbi:MAG: DUF7832 domain-containing protein [Aureliella sp.]